MKYQYAFIQVMAKIPADVSVDLFVDHINDCDMIETISVKVKHIQEFPHSEGEDAQARKITSGAQQHDVAQSNDCYDYYDQDDEADDEDDEDDYYGDDDY